MFIEAVGRTIPHPSGVQCAASTLSDRRAADIAPRWGALRTTNWFYKHSTPNGVG